MKIKKIGHCCLLIKLDKLTILTDPGMFSVEQNTIKGIDIVLITHEHFDHLHIDSVKEILKHNPKVQIITNSAVGAQLQKASIEFTLLEGKAKTKIGGVSLEASDGKHVEIFEDYGQVQNTGYFIDEKLFYPGDSFHDPEKRVDILALPVAGPWCKIADAVRYALKIKPNKAFPVHDGMLQKDRLGGNHKIPSIYLPKNGIEFVIMNDGDEKDFL